MMGENNINNTNNIDVIIVMDSTGSMQSWINSAKNTVINAFSDIRNQYPNSTIRLGLVCYRDIGDKDRFILASLTENIESIQEVLKDVIATGGNDTAEDVGGALEKVIDLFNEEKDPGQVQYNPVRIVLFVADAPAHGLRYHSITLGDRFPNGDPEGKDPYDKVVEMVNMNIDLTIFRINSTLDKMIEEFQKAFIGSKAVLTVLDVSSQNNLSKSDDRLKDVYIDYYGSPLLSTTSLNGFIDLSSYSDDYSDDLIKPLSKSPEETFSEKTFRSATCSSISSSIQRRKDMNK